MTHDETSTVLAVTLIIKSLIQQPRDRLPILFLRHLRERADRYILKVIRLVRGRARLCNQAF